MVYSQEPVIIGDPDSGEVNKAECGKDLCNESLPGIESYQIVLHAHEEEQQGCHHKVSHSFEVAVDRHQESEGKAGKDGYSPKGGNLLFMHFPRSGTIGKVTH